MWHLCSHHGTKPKSRIGGAPENRRLPAVSAYTPSREIDEDALKGSEAARSGWWTGLDAKVRRKATKTVTLNDRCGRSWSSGVAAHQRYADCPKLPPLLALPRPRAPNERFEMRHPSLNNYVSFDHVVVTKDFTATLIEPMVRSYKA